MELMQVKKAKQDISTRKVKQTVCNAVIQAMEISAGKAFPTGNARYVGQVCSTGHEGFPSFFGHAGHTRCGS